MNYNLVEEKVLNSLKNSLNLDGSISKKNIALHKVASWDSLNHLNVIINFPLMHFSIYLPSTQG